MLSYETSTAVHFIIFAVLFTSAFAFATWRIIRNLEKENQTVIQEDDPPEEANSDDSAVEDTKEQ